LGTLYLVGTPIGNLEDITLRALRVLKEVDLIAAEDTRRTAHLLRHYEIGTPMVSHYAPRELSQVPRLMEALASKDVALVSEAGMPGISDPGYPLVRAAIEAGIPVVPIPGPSALLSALAVSGLPSRQFVYLGFLPRRGKDRRALLSSLATEKRTLVAFESPHRLVAALEDASATLGDRCVAVAREMTKVHEEIFRGTVAQALERFGDGRPRGEFTLVIEGAPEEEPWEEARVRELIRTLDGENLGRKELAARVAAEAGWLRRDVYQLVVSPREDEDEVAG
jgi:16S rRNA (cytidine1402-2'-O)-methyltransferase